MQQQRRSKQNDNNTNIGENKCMINKVNQQMAPAFVQRRKSFAQETNVEKYIFLSSTEMHQSIF